MLLYADIGSTDQFTELSNLSSSDVYTEIPELEVEAPKIIVGKSSSYLNAFKYTIIIFILLNIITRSYFIFCTKYREESKLESSSKYDKTQILFNYLHMFIEWLPGKGLFIIDAQSISTADKVKLKILSLLPFFSTILSIFIIVRTKTTKAIIKILIPVFVYLIVVVLFKLLSIKANSLNSNFSSSNDGFINYLELTAKIPGINKSENK